MVIEQKKWKVGELAKQTGITVRTLHHYDQIGLFSPSQYSESGHRLYTEADIAKLQQIMSLRQLGFSLEQIRELMENPRFNPLEVIRVQLERVQEQIRIQQELHSQLAGLYRLLHSQQEVQVEQFIQLIEVTHVSMMNNYFTPEQLEKLKHLSERFGQEKIQEVQNEWVGLIAQVRTELEKGTPTEHPDVLQLAKRWKELVDMFSGGDMGIVQAAERFHAENPGNPLQYGIDGELYRYINQAISRL